MKRLGVGISFLAAFVSSIAYSQASGFFLDRMPTIKGAILNPTDINDSGSIVGSTSIAIQVFPDGTYQAFKGLGENYAIVNNSLIVSAVSNSGAAAGSGYNASGLPRGVFWDATGIPWELVPPQTLTSTAYVYDGDTSAVDIDEHENIVGSAGCNYGDSCPVIWHGVKPSGAVALEKTFIPYGPPELETPTAISRNGEWVSGFASPDRSPVLAEMWHNGSVSRIQSYADGYGINNSGTMVGDMGVGPDTCPDNPFGLECLTYVAAMWGPHAVKLSLLPGTTTSVAWAINNSNIVVGSNGGHAVKWDAAGHVTDLNKLMSAQLPSNTVLTDAAKITDGGKILVHARTSNGGNGYYRLTPTIPNSIKISSNINPASYGQQVHLVASIIPSKTAPVPQGNVQWYDNGKLLGSAGLTIIGTASCEPSTWAPGLHKITVSYNGYSPNASGKSAIFNQTINVASTKTALAASATSVTHGQTVKLTATVSPAFGTISGLVVFKSGSTVLGTATVNSRTKQAALSTMLKTAGKYSIAASYVSSTDYSGSTSAVVTVTAK